MKKNFTVVIETFPFEQAALTYNRMMITNVHFRSVLKIGGS